MTAEAIEATLHDTDLKGVGPISVFFPVDHSETLVEEFCHFCGKLQAIAGFTGDQKRNATLLITCLPCSPKAKALKRPPQDELIIASILKGEGAASDEQLALLKKWGEPDKDGKRYQFLLSFHKAKKSVAVKDFETSTHELLSIIKTLARI